MTTLQLPSRHDEAWRWSDLSAISQIAERAPRGRAHEALPWLEAYDGPRLLFVDGKLDHARSSPGPVTLGSVDPLDHPLAAQAGGEGWRLHIGRDHAPGCPIQIVHVTTGGADHLAAEILLDADAQASIVETYVGDGWTNRAARIRLAQGARLMHSRRLLGASGYVSLTDDVEIGGGASYIAATLAAGGADSRLDGSLRLTGEGAYAEADGALLARGQQRHDANLILHHAQPNGTSRQIWRSVADDQSICSVAARVEVARHAQKTDGEQSLKGIMLSRSATINAKPELEIFADDVKCAHGATVGELDRNALFYLASRGVGQAEAKGLLTRAFVADAIERVGEEAVRDAFHADVERWFGGARG